MPTIHKIDHSNRARNDGLAVLNPAYIGRRQIAMLCGLGSFVVYVLTASGYAHWLDGGEFVAVAADFGISHPPGHPLSTVVFGAANLVPIGSLAFRVTLLCAALVGLAASFLFLAYDASLKTAGVLDQHARHAIALGATWWVAASAGWWLQAIRPEVYALQALLTCVLLERWTALVRDTTKLGPLYASAFIWGLALSNHHYVALLIIPAALPTLIRIGRSQGMRPIIGSAGWTFLGLATYLVLPLRAMASPYLNLGDPDSPGRFLWTISARAFQKSLRAEEIQPLGERVADVFVAMSDSLHGGVLILAMLGLYLSFRHKPAARLAVMWALLFISFAFGRAALGFTRGNPDALGYLMGGAAALVWFAMFAIAAVYQIAFDRVAETSQRWMRYAAIASCVALAIVQVVRVGPEVSLANFTDTDTLDDGIRRTVPDNAVVFVHNPQTMFRFWGGQAQEYARPDITLVPVPFLTYPNLVQSLVGQHPELAGALRGFLIHGKLQNVDLQNLSVTRPVMVELDLHSPQAWPALAPWGYYHRFAGQELNNKTLDDGAKQQSRFWRDTYRALGTPTDKQTIAVLLWRHYQDALYYARGGAIERAKESVARGLALNPFAQELVALDNTLARSDGPVDVRPFLVESVTDR